MGCAGAIPATRIFALARFLDWHRALSAAVLRAFLQSGGQRHRMWGDTCERDRRFCAAVRQSRRPRRRTSFACVSDRDDWAVAHASSTGIRNWRLLIRAIPLSCALHPIADPLFPGGLDRRTVVDIVFRRVSACAGGSRNLVALA